MCVATFSALRFGVPGTYTIMAVDGALGTAVSRTFTVTAAAKLLQWAAEPVGPVLAGQKLNNVTVWVEDRNKNHVTSDHSVVTLAISTGPTGGTITGNATTNAINGLATFSNVSFSKAGTYVLTVTGTGLTAALSKKFDVVAAGTTSQLVVTSATASTPTTVIGKSFKDITIAVEDSFGNIMVRQTSNVTLSLVGTTGTLIGSKTVTTKNGVATFHNLAINSVGTFTITATDNALANPSTQFSATVSQISTIVSTPTHASQYAVGAPITLTTHLSALGGSSLAWTGNVRLVDSSNTTLLTQAINAGGNATFHLAGQTASIYSLHVVYDGDANHLPSVSPVFNLTVGPGTTVQVKPLSATTIPSGGTVTLSVKVAANNGSALVRTGAVTLMEGATVLSTTSLSASAATLTPTFTTGTHILTVVYSGDSNFRASTSSVLTIKAT